MTDSTPDGDVTSISAEGARTPAALDLPGPARRIRVDPIRVPKPTRTPAPAEPAPAEPPPAEPAPAPPPPRETPAPREPSRPEREPVPA